MPAGDTPEIAAADAALEGAINQSLAAYGFFDDGAKLVTGFVVVGALEGDDPDTTQYFDLHPGHGMQAPHTSIGLLITLERVVSRRLLGI